MYDVLQIICFTGLVRLLAAMCCQTLCVCDSSRTVQCTSSFMMFRFGVTRHDLVVALPSDPSRAALIQASKAWRQARIHLPAYSLFTPTILCLLAHSLIHASSYLPHLLSLPRKQTSQLAQSCVKTICACIFSHVCENSCTTLHFYVILLGDDILSADKSQMRA